MPDNTVLFEFEGKLFEVPIAATVADGDVALLPDGRFVTLNCSETMPPQVIEVIVVDGPVDVPDPSGRGAGHEGQAFDAIEIPSTVINCECESTACHLTMRVSLETAQNILRRGIAVILDGCRRGPSAGDRLVETRQGYKIYTAE